MKSNASTAHGKDARGAEVPGVLVGLGLAMALSGCVSRNPDPIDVDPSSVRTPGERGEGSIGPMAESGGGPAPIRDPDGSSERGGAPVVPPGDAPSGSGDVAAGTDDGIETGETLLGPTSTTTGGPGTAPPRDPQDPAGGVARLLGSVGGKPISTDQFMRRAWWRNQPEMKAILDQLVVERLVILEAERLGLGVDPGQVEAQLTPALQALRDRAAELGVEVEEMIRSRDYDPEIYRLQMRNDAIVELLLHRAVRAFVLEREHCVVRMLEVPDRAAVAEVEKGIAEGRGYADLLEAHGIPEVRAEGEREMVLVQDERSPLVRLAFRSPVGEVAGPLSMDGVFVFLWVDEKIAPVDPETVSLRTLVEGSLANRGPDEFEYLQWRAAMSQRYSIDLSSFTEFVDGGQ